MKQNTVLTLSQTVYVKRRCYKQRWKTLFMERKN